MSGLRLRLSGKLPLTEDIKLCLAYDAKANAIACAKYAASPKGKASRKRRNKRWRKRHPDYVRPNVKEQSARYRKKPGFKEYMRKAAAKWRAKYPGKRRAHVKVMIAIKGGKLQRGVCPCGETKTQAHHDDYRKPLEVRWLCRDCHMKLHRKRG